jgi:hypothetical protein
VFPWVDIILFQHRMVFFDLKLSFLAGKGEMVWYVVITIYMVDVVVINTYFVLD